MGSIGMKVLVITVGGLHVGYVGCYGNEWVATPVLDGLAAEGVVFDQHFADCPDVAEARRAWRTGRYRFAGPQGGSSAEVEEPDLIGLLRGQGITTSLVVDGRRPSPGTFVEGWDHVRRVPTSVDKGRPLEKLSGVVRDSWSHLAGVSQWLLWLDLSTLLAPWHVSGDFLGRYFKDDEADEETDAVEAGPAEEPLTPLKHPVPGLLGATEETTFLRLQRTYAGAVSNFDAGLGRLLGDLRGQGWPDDLLLLLTTDSGQALGEHGMVGAFRPWLHDELIHLPLIVRLPGGEEAGRRLDLITQSVDLMPTLVDAFGLPRLPVHGHSLLPLLRGQSEPVRTYACAGLQLAGAVEWALRTPDWAFLLPVQAPPEDPPRSRQLYVKPDDRWEVNNVLQHHLELAEHLEQTLRGFVQATSFPGPLKPPELRDVEAEAAAREPAIGPNELTGGSS
jgi:arylsulfatase A-like enzyme